jgi:hypothetical protein
MDIESKLRQALQECVEMMENQEKRESGEFHWNAEAFYPLWRETINNAKRALALEPSSINPEYSCSTCTNIRCENRKSGGACISHIKNTDYTGGTQRSK